MPKTKKRQVIVRRRRQPVIRRRRMHGKGFMDFLKKANKFLRKTKLISKAGSVLGELGIPYAAPVAKYAGLAGYGRKKTVRRRRRRRGGALNLAGARGRGVGLAGGRYKKKIAPLPIAY